MPSFEPLDPDFAARVRASFAAQPLMRTLGAALTDVRPGEVRIEMPFDAALTQQNGFIHAGAITSIADSACGYAALSLMPPRAGVLTVEFKVNLLNPARGERFVATGKVVKPGRTLTICQGEVVAESAGTRQPVAMMQATMMQIAPKEKT